MPSILDLEREFTTLNDEIDAIHGRHPKESPEYQAILDLNGLLYRFVRDADQRPSTSQQLADHLDAHVTNPALHGDMLGISRRFCRMVEISLEINRLEKESNQ